MDSRSYTNSRSFFFNQKSYSMHL
uniref:Uncharacterized protein n=1 Tax=Rhizophora mucronata TaxID=61149 RepID=A0A2P2PIY2_RHIMU